MAYPMYNPYQFMNPIMTPQQPQSQIMQESNLLIPIHSEQEVFNRPVAPGNSVNFKHETEPYIYVKTMGFSQFDRPVIVKYRLVKEEIGDATNEPKDSTENDVKVLNMDDLKPVMDDIKVVKEELNTIKKRIDSLNNRPTEQKPQLPKKESK